MAGIDDRSLIDLLDGITDASDLSSDISLPLNLTDMTHMDFSDLDNHFFGNDLLLINRAFHWVSFSDEFLQPFQGEEGLFVS